MKISFVLDTFGGGGKERRCLQLLQGLNNRGFNNIQVIILDGEIAYQELYELKIELNILDRKNKGLNLFQTALSTHSLLKTFNPDIVQVWGIFSTLFTNPIRFIRRFYYIGSYVANCNKPSKFSIQGLTILLNIWLSDYIIGNSEAGILAYGIPRKKARVIYNGFNQERYKRHSSNIRSIKKEMNFNANYLVSMVARLDDNKDHETFIKAAKLISKTRFDVLFLIVGHGPNLLKISSLISESEKKFVKFLGFRKDVERILRITDVSVLCTNSKMHKEGVSNSIMESLAFGVPVVATNDGGTPEIIESGVNGFLVKEKDPEELHHQILKIIDNQDLRIKFSLAAKQTIKSKFTLERMTNQYIELYNSLVNK